MVTGSEAAATLWRAERSCRVDMSPMSNVTYRVDMSPMSNVTYMSTTYT